MKILRTRDVKLPVRANVTDAGMDFFVPNDFKSITLQPNESVLIPAGIKVNIPDGHALIAFNKSGVATKRGLIVGACVIDQSYQGELHLHLINVSNKPEIVNAGEKITQMVCLPINYVSIEEVKDEYELNSGLVSTRGDGGFGSTGTK